jgi:hypothetical protein
MFAISCWSRPGRKTAKDAKPLTIRWTRGLGQGWALLPRSAGGGLRRLYVLSLGVVGGLGSLGLLLPFSGG